MDGLNVLLYPGQGFLRSSQKVLFCHSLVFMLWVLDSGLMMTDERVRLGPHANQTTVVTLTWEESDFTLIKKRRRLSLYLSSRCSCLLAISTADGPPRFLCSLQTNHSNHALISIMLSRSELKPFSENVTDHYFKSVGRSHLSSPYAAVCRAVAARSRWRQLSDRKLLSFPALNDPSDPHVCLPASHGGGRMAGAACVYPCGGV